jgi:hypothetical protein
MLPTLAQDCVLGLANLPDCVRIVLANLKLTSAVGYVYKFRYKIPIQSGKIGGHKMRCANLAPDWQISEAQTCRQRQVALR